MGKAAVDGWCLGEVAILFSMTRPCQTTNIIPFEGHVPGIVYLLMFICFSTGFMFIYFEIRSWMPRKARRPPSAVLE